MITTLTPAEVNAVSHALDDHAAHYYTPGAAMAYHDVAHSVLTEHLADLAAARGMSAVFAMITHELRQDPTRLMLSAAERIRRRELRRSRAERTLNQAEQAYFGAHYTLAGELVDRADLTDSSISTASLRERINDAVARGHRHAGEPVPRPGDHTLCVWKLLARLARLDPAESSSTAARTLARLEHRNSVVLDQHEHQAVASLAVYCANAAVYAAMADGPADRRGDAALSLLRSADEAHEMLRQIGVPRGHIDDPSMHAVVDATDRALTWAIVVVGADEARRRLTTLSPISPAQN